MSGAKTPKKSGKKRAKKPGRIFRFKIDAFTPETMPMARLAEYLADLAVILGETKSVHLLEIEEGSTALVHQVEHEAIPKVRGRVGAVRRGEAPEPAQNSYRRVNKLLREDNAKAVLRELKQGPRILEFPGTAEAEDVYPSVNQYGSVSGVVLRVGGTGDQIPVLMESEGAQIAGCHTKRDTAKALAHHLFESVRLSGQGYWMRDSEGDWVLKHFRIDAFEPLESGTLSTALAELRNVASDWEDGVYEDLEAMRHGRSADGSD